MELKYFPIGGFIYCMLTLPSAYGAACVTEGVTRVDAVTEYGSRCNLPVRDCDPVDGRWYCSSENIDSTTFNSIVQPSQTAAQPTAIARNEPSALFAEESCVDEDGDGWGWNGVSSCRIGTVENTSKKGTSQIIVAVPPSTNRCLDPDGDGWGWDGSASCRTVQPATMSSAGVQPGLAKDSDGSCAGSANPSDITDLILVTGQSNVTGAETRVSATLNRWGKVIEFYAPDEPHPRVFAWTVDPSNSNAGTGWKVAALNQSWHDSAPGVGGIARNNFAFHFAKQVADRGDCKVVGFVMVSEGGKGISHWDYNAPGWNEVVMQVNEAMAAIGRSAIDGVLWHQGESDWIIDGTCYTGNRCRNGLPDYYAQKLYSKIASSSVANTVGGSALIDRLRRESWFGHGKPFIAGETINAPVNVHLNKLNTDNDQWTACVDSDLQSGLGIRADDPFKNHYNAAGLRELGARYATEYLKMTDH